MRIDLDVPYAEKDEAKSNGARWDARKKTWYVQDVDNLIPFLQWIDPRLLKPHGALSQKKRQARTASDDDPRWTPWVERESTVFPGRTVFERTSKY